MKNWVNFFKIREIGATDHPAFWLTFRCTVINLKFFFKSRLQLCHNSVVRKRCWSPSEQAKFPKLKHLVLTPGQSWEEQEWELPTGNGIFNEHLSLWHSTVLEDRRGYLLSYRWAAQVKNQEQLACRYTTTELRRHYFKSHTWKFNAFYIEVICTFWLFCVEHFPRLCIFT